MPGYTIMCDQIAALFSDKLNLDVPSVETDLIETGVLDSLKFVELLVALEQEFGTHISLEEFEIDNFRSIAKITQYVAQHNGLGMRESK